MHHPRNIPAFTLIEVLVTMVIIALITAGLSVSLSIAFKARRASVDGLETIRSARIGLDSLGRDLQSTLPPTGVFASAFTGTDAASSLGGSGDGDSVTFSNTADPTRTADGAGDIQQVTLSLVPDADISVPVASPRNQSGPQPAITPPTNFVGPRVSQTGAVGDGMLVRTVNRQLLAPVAPSPAQQVLCRHVRSFNLRYFDGNQWLDTWDSTAVSNALPVAVEATIQIMPPQSSSQSSTIPAVTPITIVRVYPITCADIGAIGTTTGGSASTP